MSKRVAWSYSGLAAYETCPLRYYLTKVSKQVVEPQSKAMIEGNRVHKSLENAVNGKFPLPTDLSHVQPVVDMLRLAKGVKHTEMKFGLTADYKPTTFFAKDVWFRGVIDLAIVTEKAAALVDWKTGKVKADEDQLKLFAMAGFSLWPHVEHVHTKYVWLGHKETTSNKFDREDVIAIKEEFEPRVARMDESMATNEWPARPSGLCREWCPVGKKLCAHCGKD